MAESEDLTVDKLCSGDRPSLYITGMVVAHALKKSRTVTLGVDVLGRVRVVAPDGVELKKPLWIHDEELNALSEDDAIRIMVKEERSEDDILGYLTRRKESVYDGE